MAEGSNDTPAGADEVAGVVAPALPPLDAYRAALKAYDPAFLREVARVADVRSLTFSSALAGEVAEALSDAKAVARLVQGLDLGGRLGLTLFALTEAPSWPALGLMHALACLGAPPVESVQALIERGLVAAELPANSFRFDLKRRLDEDPTGVTLHAHPAALGASRTTLPTAATLPRAGPTRSPREADGLEPVLRASVVWQRVAAAPLRQTQLGTFYKRDRERLEDDTALAGPVADALEPIPDMPAFWLTLARGVGLLEAEAGSDRVTAAPPEFFAENAFHLPQMLAARWLGLWTWHEQGGVQQDGAEVMLAFPFVRAPVLLWLATLDPDDWVATEDLAAVLRDREPRWDRPAFQGDVVLDGSDRKPQPPARGKAKAKVKERDPIEAGVAALEAMVLGAGYQFNLVRAAEEVDTGRRVVQLSRLGRYVLSLGPPPPPKPAFDQFLYVQPNFEIIAYRQGLNPLLVGKFSRFAQWTQVGAALALRLTPESIYTGLEGGMTPQAMLDLLQRHNPRPLPAGVNEAIRAWAGRRERVTYHAAATLIEFADGDALERALAVWPERDDRPAPVRVSDRLLLVEDDRAIPFDKFRLVGSRDYRKPPDACVEVEADGVTLTLDPTRSDLLVDAELARFTDEAPPESPRGTGSGSAIHPRRRFLVTAESLTRAAEGGLNGAQLAAWFPRRTGAEIPPSIRLLLLAGTTRIPPLSSGRPLVLRTTSAEVLDGLTQHPDTSPYLGERLGPTAVVVPDYALASFREALKRLGLSMDGEAE